ncbi:intracellular short-chain-length polyhydroxyalkanoate depolymerase [Paenibacillus apiarius]|uniref:Alpha/beta hydrolase n=1 Tax=Paenibacillus apiarius TaxID=46240 RepID=A0ABT4E092_9BACL|nr:alpha/beta hydrolase [Paenibacillus apiarius]MBN3525467.1 alpha/beta hydrolase [Paenibacillus apiarius]MCY9512684.1 alpha/beta hydrolase [Paenibacillus apiarius]MCY9523024.1 alpha/beta hydrolase [Paenibacillus apiarius]MCY9550714.1 alpha/beta hydrolase [Paenibacillus apiarius]MCY9556538.1 alpha/beta hydrolase [Paenibacillus apiarius]
MKAELKSVLLPNGETLGYREREGGDEVILLIHGNMNSSYHWDVVLEHLDARYKVYAIDLRGFGISTYHQPIRALRQFSEDVKLFAQAIGLKQFAVMGWSTGGGVAMELAADWPEAVTKLILLASVSTRGYPFYDNGENGLPDVTKRIATYEGIEALPRNQAVREANAREDRAFMKQLYEAVIYDRNRPDEARYEAYIDDILTQRNLMDVYYALNAFNISVFDNEAAAGSGAVQRIAAPTLVLRGERDMVISEAMAAETLADLGAIAQFISLQDCGHSPLVDDLPQLLQAVEAFLSSEVSIQRH